MVAVTETCVMPSNDLFASARFKIDRASEHIREISETISETRPFRYTLETNAVTLERSLGAEQDDATIHRIAGVAGDAVHNLRSAIDHAYSAVVLPHARTDSERRAVQFPTSKSEARLEKSVISRLADRVSPEFVDAIMKLKPHGEQGGNKLLYLIHDLDISDKHASFIPTADYTALSGETIKRYAPDCPIPDAAQTLTFCHNRRDVSWDFYLPGVISWTTLGFPLHGVIKQEIDVPVKIVFKVCPTGERMVMIPTLHQFVDVTKSVVGIIQQFS